MIVGQDTDFLSIGTLAANKQQQLLELSGEEGTLGKLFVRMTSQNVPLGVDVSSESFSEDYWCTELATQIKAYPGFSKLRVGSAEEVVALEHRVPSVIALFILLGGDATSYLYLPYTKSLEWYLAHAEFVGALVRTPTEEENREGWPLALDEEAVKRLFKVLYACRNPRAIDRWTSLPLPERYAALRDTSYEELESKVARCVFPLTMRFKPKWALMAQHLLRAQHRLRTWYNADLRSPPDVPLVGHVVLMAPPSGTMDEGGIEKLEAPTEATVAARCEQGWSVMRVEPNVAPVNTTLAEYFGPVLPPEVLLRGTKARAPRSAERARKEREKRAPLLAEARARMKPQSPHKPTKPHMVAVAVALKVFEGGTARDLATLRESMNSAQNARAVFDELVLSRGESGFPWREMGAPEENECGGSLGSDSDSDDNAFENEAVEDDEEEAAVDCEAAEDAADEEGEDLALGALFDSVVTAVGAEAEDLVVEIDDAASDADALAVAEARIEAGLGLEQRAP